MASSSWNELGLGGGAARETALELGLGCEFNAPRALPVRAGFPLALPGPPTPMESRGTQASPAAIFLYKQVL